MSQLQYDQQNDISVFTVTVCLFSRKESLWDIAVRMNTEQQDTKPASGSQPKERTILILGSKGVVSITFLAPWSAHYCRCTINIMRKYSKIVKLSLCPSKMAYTVVQAALHTFLTLVLDAGIGQLYTMGVLSLVPTE
jgi:hypothetical protein